ncbi:MAG: orotidine 5'-phosphate decarboxylase / HUMPS family protein [Pseudomonadota bacterium]
MDVRVIPALDVSDLDRVSAIAAAVGRHPGVYGFKVGFSLGLSHGLPVVVERIRAWSDKPVIYDHQKAGTDIPDTGGLFARTLADAGIDEGILFPQAGPATLAAWVDALQDAGLKVIVGGLMTHRAYQASEGGFLRDDGIMQIYRDAAARGVRSFVVPLTKPEAVRRIADEVDRAGDVEFYSPGYGSQGGDPGDLGFLARLNLIVGRSLLLAEDPAAYIDSIIRREWTT